MPRMTIAEIRALPEPGERPETPAETLRRKFPHDLWELVRNRIVMGYARYGAGRTAWAERVIADPADVSFARLVSKLIQFRRTGNMEFLVDVVTYACLIWRFGDGLHFRAVERHEIAELKAEADALAPMVLRMMETGDASPA